MDSTLVLIGIGFLIIGVISGIIGLNVYQKVQEDNRRASAKSEADKIIDKAKAQASRIDKEAKNKAKEFESRARKNAENDIKKQKQKVVQAENQFRDKEKRLDGEYKKKEDALDSKMRDLDDQNERLIIAEERLAQLEKKAKEELQTLTERLESVAGMSQEQAAEELSRALESEAREEAAAQISIIEKEAEEEARKRSRMVLATAISRIASEVATEKTVSILPLTSDEMKGKIIGREGRNIRALEAACGVDLIVDETPEAVVISCFDPVRREVARRVLVKLMEDGRVHPARIEEVVTRIKSDLLKSFKEEGEKACLELGITVPHAAILSLLGSLKYRQAMTQNLLKQSLEVAFVAGLLAEEIGSDVKAAKRAGLLFGIGRGIDHTVEGSYSKVGADFAKKHGEKDTIVHAIRAVECEVEPRSILAHIVQSAYNFSKSRPGTKRNMMDSYVRRLNDLESIGNSFDGVSRTFALQAGKEVRVLVDGGKVTDGQAQMLSKDIARKIERELNYPGNVKVVVLRETRIVEHAR